MQVNGNSTWQESRNPLLRSQSNDSDEETSASQFFSISCGTLLSIPLLSGYVAGSGATGAAVLNAAGYEGYSALVGAQTGAVGGAVVGAGTVLLGLGLYCCFGESLMNLLNDSHSLNSTLCSSVGWNIVSGMVGYVALRVSDVPVMEIGPTVASFASGSAIVGAGMLCCFCALGSSLWCCLPPSFFKP